MALDQLPPGWMRNRDHLVRARAEAATAQQKLEAVPRDATERELTYALSDAESAVQSIRYAEEGIERRRNETLLFGGGAVAVLALGTFLVLRGRRKQTRAVATRSAVAAAA